MTLPSNIIINGKSPFKQPNSGDLAVDGHPGWTYRVYSGDVPVMIWSHADHGPKPVHVQVVSRAQYGTQATLLLNDDYLLDYHSGRAWTSDSYLKAIANVDETSFDDRLFWPPDVKVTRYTGSMGNSLYQPEACIALTEGLSPRLAQWFDGYACWQAARPRWWLSPAGAPTGLSQNWKQHEPKGFHEWRENVHGMNAWDLHHLDADELYSGYKLTKDPWYLWQLTTLFISVKRLGWYVRQEPNNDYGGVPRVPGWYFNLLGRLHDCLKDLDGVWTQVRNEVDDAISWHLKMTEWIIANRFPMVTMTGSTGPAFHGVPHTKPWQMAVWAWGLQAVAHGAPKYKVRATAAAEFILDWINEHAFTGSQIVYTIAGDLSIRHIGYPDLGTASWHLAPLLRSKKQRPIGTFLRDYVINESGHSAPHKSYYRSVVSYAAPALGLKFLEA